MRWALHVILVSTFLVALESTSAAMTVSGSAQVLDGDTIVIEGQVIRIHGIDAPETAQVCQDLRGRDYRCGETAAEQVRALVHDVTVECTGEGFDQYERLIAKCTTPRGDLARTLVTEGLALAYVRYSRDYVDGEATARQQGVGLWSGTFEAPWEYRANKWRETSQTAPRAECPIKGNVNRRGERIYHAPWSRHYDRTRIDTSRGERWFCTEAEALAAGWRAPIR